MNKTLLSLSLTVLTVVPSSAQEHLQREAVASSAEKSFTVVMQLPVTSIKNQYRSGTCWDYATPSAAACLSPGSYNSNVHLTPKTILSRVFFFYGLRQDAATISGICRRSEGVSLQLRKLFH